MIIRYPDYYEKFACIAGACEDTCCAGWEIDLDEETYEAYQKVTGPMGERLRREIKEYELDEDEAYEAHGFRLCPDGRCPFLNEKNLCDIYRELGEDALSYVCTHTPRNYLEYGGAKEIAVSISCPEAGRLVFGQTEPVKLIEIQEEGEISYEETPEEVQEAEFIKTVRDRVMDMLQDRSEPIEKRILSMLSYAQFVQQHINDGTWADMGEWQRETIQPSQESAARLMECRMKSYSQLDSINERWEKVLSGMYERYMQPENGALVYEEDWKKFRTYLKNGQGELWLEKLAVYLVYMCLARCVDGMDFLNEVKFIVTSYEMILDMECFSFAGKQKIFDLEDFSYMARIYAKEVEHSQDNLCFLAEECLFEEAYELPSLARGIQAMEKVEKNS